MLQSLRAFAATAIGALVASAAVHASNPIITDRFVADPSAHVFGHRVYVYATDDSDNDGTYWNSRDWRLYSSADFVHWRDHGAIFAASRFSWAHGLAWAPDAAEWGGRYFLYLPVDRARIGVAESASPAGPFKDAIGLPLIDKARDANVGDEPIDPAVFVDRDGQAYLYFGSRIPKVVKLGRDMKSLAGPIRNLEIRDQRVPYGEAPWLHRRGKLYYFSYSTGWPGQIAYATASSPSGPFRQRGIILDRVNIDTNHHAIVEKGGKWYIFYHSSGLPGGGAFRRSINLDRLYYNPDGTIRRVVMTHPADTK